MTTRSISPRQVRSSVIALAAAGAAALAVLAALGARGMATNGDRMGAPLTTQVSLQAGADAVPARRGPSAPVYLIVASVEQGESVRQQYLALDRATRPLGEAAATVVPLVAESDAQAAEMRRSVYDMNVLREGEGLALFTISDRRGSAAAATP